MAQSSAARARPIEPGISAELGPAQAPGGTGDAGTMVPFRASGTWQFQGTGTHTGRLQGVETIHRSTDGEYLSHSVMLTAANGDTLHFQRCRDRGTEPTYYDDDTFVGVGTELVGGTGRVMDATGWYTIRGTGWQIGEGTYSVEGEISSVGSRR